MDLLNSILNSMDKSGPPKVNEQQRELIKEQKANAERVQKKLTRFRNYVEDRISRFSKDDRTHIEFVPCEKLFRSIIHEIAENGGFIAMSFGVEDVDRYTVVYKKESAPSEDEISARRNGDGWNAEILKIYADRRIEQRKLEDEQKQARANAASSGHDGNADNATKPTCKNYKEKYAHLIGQSAALEAARKTETNQSYGFVPSKNKKDMRSIEQTLADIKAKKRRRLEQEQSQVQNDEPANIKSATDEDFPVSIDGQKND